MKDMMTIIPRSSNLLSLFLTTILLMLGVGNRVLADANVTFHGELIEAPPCVINNGQNIVVDFGSEVMTTRIDGSNYRQAVSFTLDCSEAVSSKQRVRISGTTASFDPRALVVTEKPGLAIALYNGAERYTPGEWIPFTEPAIPDLQAVLIKQDGTVLDGGAFSALASLVVDYQ